MFCTNISNIESKQKQDYFYGELFTLISALHHNINRKSEKLTLKNTERK